MLRLLTILTTFVMLTTTGCAAPMGPREGTGTLLGAGTGALVGSQIGGGTGRIVATAAGTLFGALIGQDIGRTLDRVDQTYLQRTSQYSLENTPSNHSTTWVNPDTGHQGSVTPTRTYQVNDGRYCREFTQTVQVGGKLQQAYGTACRQPDGSWQLVSSQPQPQPQVETVVVRERVVEPAYPPVYAPAYYPSYYPTYWPFATSLSFSWVEHSGGGRHHRPYRGHHDRGWHR